MLGLLLWNNNNYHSNMNKPINSKLPVLLTVAGVIVLAAAVTWP